MDKFQEIIESPEKILITSHVMPDWDAVASLVSTYRYLIQAYPNKEIKAVLTGEKYESFQKFNEIEWIRDISDIVNNYDTLIFLDGNTLNRFTNESSKIDLQKFKRICIDHHTNPPDNFDLNLSETTQASCAQLIYKLFFRDSEFLNIEIAEILLTGMIADTGTFKYINYQKTNTFEYAKELIEFGKFDIQEIEMKISQFSMRELEILNILISNTSNIEVESKPPFSYSFLPLDSIDKYGIEEIKRSNDKYKMLFLRQIKDHNWGFVVTPDSKEKLGISFRSTPGAPNVQKLAQAFNGGGHIMAAGGSYEIDDKVKDSEDLVELLLEYIKNNEIELT